MLLADSLMRIVPMAVLRSVVTHILTGKQVHFGGHSPVIDVLMQGVDFSCAVSVPLLIWRCDTERVVLTDEAIIARPGIWARPVRHLNDRIPSADQDYGRPIMVPWLVSGRQDHQPGLLASCQWRHRKNKATSGAGDAYPTDLLPHAAIVLVQR